MLGAQHRSQQSTEVGNNVSDRSPARSGKGRERTSPATFYRQVIAELRKVIWPTRKELMTYTSVVIVFVLIVIAYVTVLDYGFSKAMFAVFG